VTERHCAPALGFGVHYGLLLVAMTNEERFIASCQSVGEADVRQKLNANRYTGQRAVWASGWLERVENGKSDATKAEERNTPLLGAKPKPYFIYTVSALLSVLLIAGVSLFLKYD
jgi:hypothetical protein